MSEQDIFLHERLFRDISEHADKTITICGAGAIGSNLALLLAPQNFLNLRIIDKDRVEERNIGTQLFTLQDLNSYKVHVLRRYLYRKCKAKIEPHTVELTYGNATTLFSGSDVVIDTFDNSKSRKIVKDVCSELRLPCIHTGMSSDGYCEVAWNEKYRLARDSGMDLCEYPLSLNLVWIATALTAETIIRYFHMNEKKNYWFTLSDFRIIET